MQERLLYRNYNIARYFPESPVSTNYRTKDLIGIRNWLIYF